MTAGEIHHEDERTVKDGDDEEESSGGGGGISDREGDVRGPLLGSTLSEEKGNSSTIRDFFEGRSILVTGVTGFLGKALLLKLLKSCPSLDKVYVIVRSKKNREPHERIATILETAESSGSLSSEQTSKVVAIAGDISKADLGLSEEDTRKMIEAGISVVFHSAATVRFNEPLKDAIEINVGGTQAILKLCKKFKRMQALVYVSTAYSNCNLQRIEEVVYESNIPAQGILQTSRWMTEGQMEALAPLVMGEEWPNTYTYSKFLAENLLKDECDGLPVAIFRPTIVVNSVKEPSPGWTSSLNGPAGITLGSAMGLVRTLRVDKKLKVDIVPVDWVVNAAIASAWNLADNKVKTRVYNYSSGSRNPITWEEYMRSCEVYGHEYPPEKCFWYYSLTLTKKRWVYLILRLFLHIWPALLVDSVCSVIGKQKKMLKIYQKVDEFVELSSFFTMNQWTFQDQNLSDTWKQMTEDEKVIFPFDIEHLNWKHYFRNYMFGLRKFLLKEDPKSIPAAISRIKRLRMLHRTVQITTLFILFFIGYSLAGVISFFLK